MKTEIFYNGRAYGFYRIQWSASIYFLQPRLEIWGPLSWLKTLKKGDKIELKGDGQTLFTGRIFSVAEVSRSRVLVSAAEPLNAVIRLNFSKEKWCNILKEVWPEYSCNATDFECGHYSDKLTVRRHLARLHSKLENRTHKKYCMYLDEKNRLQIHETGKARGNAEVAGVLIKNGADYRAYNPFPLLVGMASGEGIAERLELTISNAAERLRVWWGEAEEAAGPSQHLVKGEAKEAAEAIKDFFYGNGQIINSSSRTVYAIISKTEAVIPVTSGSAYSDLIDGVVDVRGKQVYKMNENSYLEFTSEGAFVLINRDRLEGFIDNFSSEPYGIYKISDSLPEAVHEVTGYKSKAIRNWYDKARVEQ